MTPWQRAERDWLDHPEHPDIDNEGRSDCHRHPGCGRCDACEAAIDARADEEFERRRTEGA